MKVEFGELRLPLNEVRPGNVYPVAGGWGRRAGHVMVLLHITKKSKRHEGGSCLMIVCDNEGEPTGVTTYGEHALADRTPIAFVDGMDDVLLTARGII